MQIGLTALCFVFLTAWRHLPYPYSSPVLPFAHFFDLYIFTARFARLHSPAFFAPNIAEQYQYPGSMALLYGSLYATHRASVVFFAITGCAVLVMALGLARHLIRAGLSKVTAYALVICTTVLSYPLWFEWALANLEMFIFLMVAAGVWCFLRKRTFAAAILFGIAAGMKFFPGVYLGLFLARRQYKQIVVAAATAVAVNLAGLWLIGPTIPAAYEGVRLGLSRFRVHYMLTYLPQETGVDHSIIGLIKRTTWYHYHDWQLPNFAVTVYLAIAATVGAALYFWRIRNLPVTNQIAALCVASILLPPTSHDYTLLHLYVPFALLVVMAVKAGEKTVPGLLAAMVCFAVLFSSESELILAGRGFSGQAKCLALIALLFVILRFPWKPASSLPLQGSTSRPQGSAYSPAEP